MVLLTLSAAFHASRVCAVAGLPRANGAQGPLPGPDRSGRLGSLWVATPEARGRNPGSLFWTARPWGPRGGAGGCRSPPGVQVLLRGACPLSGHSGPLPGCRPPPRLRFVSLSAGPVLVCRSPPRLFRPPIGVQAPARRVQFPYLGALQFMVIFSYLVPVRPDLREHVLETARKHCFSTHLGVTCFAVEV